MKLKFKVQPYQTHAVESLADCFAGQPKSSGVSYRIDPGAKPAVPAVPRQGQLAGLELPAATSDAGFRNADLVLSPTRLLDNIQAVQRRQNLPISTALVGDKKTGCPINLDIEMETGTGKTYCYIKSMFELNKRYGWSKFIVVVPSIAIVEHIAYDPVAECYDSNIFTAEKPKEDFSKAFEAKHHVYDYVFTDSGKERAFVEQLDTSTEVVVYAKLPKSFFIPTPVGNYNPDWAIAFQDGKVKHIYFIAETKGSMSSLDLRAIEKSKIACAGKFFAKIATITYAARRRSIIASSLRTRLASSSR